MGSKMKKTLSVLLAAAMTIGSFSSLPVTISAADMTENEESLQQTTAISSVDTNDTDQNEETLESANTISGEEGEEQNNDTSEMASSFDSALTVSLDENGDTLYVRASADEGVLPNGTVFTAKKIDTEDERSKADSAVSPLRETGDILADSYLLDLTFYDADGNEIEPSGDVNLTIGLADAGNISNNAAASIKSYLFNNINEKVSEASVTDDSEALKSQINEAVDELSLSYKLSDLSFKLYHIVSNDDSSLIASKVDMTAKDSDDSMADASLIFTGKVSSFSDFQVELSVNNDFTQTIEDISRGITEGYMPAAADVAGDNTYSYRITNDNKVSISDMVAALKESAGFPDTDIISGTSSDSSVTYSGSGTSRIFTVPVGGDSYNIILSDNYGNEYIVYVYSDLPNVTKTSSPDFTIRWNDNGGNDETSLVKRPKWSEISDSYVVKYSIWKDGQEVQEAKELTKDSLAFLGLDSVPKLTPDTEKSLTSWTFSLSDLPTSYTQNIGDGSGKQTYSIAYTIEQKNVPEGYINEDSGAIEMNSSITNTVKVLFETKLIWNDNNNKYNSRPLRENIAELLKNGIITVMRYDAHSSTPSQAVTVTEDNFEFEDYDGYEVCKLVNLPAYCNEDGHYGDPYVYSVIFNPRVNPEYEASDPGAKYIGTYTNVDNYGSYTDALYNGGTLKELLSNTVDFNYTKLWDDNNNNNRPETKLYFYVVSEDDVLSGSFNTNNASAVDGYSYVSVPVENGTYTACVNLPKYDEKGKRLVYFAIERGLTGDYISGVDNTNGYSSQEVKDVFNEIKGSYINRNTGDYYPKYLLNGGTIDNRLSGTVTASVTKTINAVAMQEMNGAEINFVLQKMIKNVSEDGEISYSWIDASNGDLVSNDSSEEGQITLTLAGFRAESMTQTGTSPDLKKYNSDGEKVIYRWKEISASINGSDTKEISWEEDEVSPESMTYKTSKDVDIGKYAPGVGDSLVDVYLSGKTSTSIDDSGSTLTTVENNINAPYLLKIDKTWTVNGKNVSADIGEGGYATFEIIDSNGNAVADESGNPITITLNSSDLTEDGSKWETIYRELSRFDENGRENSYSVKEIAMDDGGYTTDQSIAYQWKRETTYSTVVDATEKGDETAKEIVARVSNYIEEPGSIYLAAKKIWQDDGDLISRAPVIAGIYYIGDDGYGLVDTITLTESNLWYKKVAVKAEGYYYQYKDGEWTAAGRLPKNVKKEDFVIVELGTGDTNAVTPALTDDEGTDVTISLPANDATLARMNFGTDETPLYRTYKEWSESDLSFMKNKITDTDTKLGIVADDETDSEGTSNYTYAASEKTGYIEPAEMDGYILTDTRIGKVNLDLTKTWNDGDENRVGHFALYRNDSEEPVFEFDLGKDNGTIIDNILETIGDIAGNLIGIQDLNTGIETGSIENLTGASYIISMESETDEHNMDVVKSYNIKFMNLPKYDENGVLYSYTLKETGIYSDEGDLVPIADDGSAAVDEHTYSTACGIDKSKGDGGTVYGELHHNDDWIYWNANNSLSGSYNLNFYKVWYDNAEEASLRPNIYFEIYRIDTNIWINNNKYTIKKWIEDELWKDGSSTYGQFNSQEAALSYLLSKYYDSKDQWEGVAERITTVTADRYYDASGNPYLWSVDVGNVNQYDENGYPYIYFAIEKGISKDSDYYGNEYYGNMKWDDLHVDTQASTAQGTYDIYNSYCYKDYVSNKLLVLSDGIHNIDGDAGAYYSRTIVNTKEDSRTVSGRKIWNTDPVNIDNTYLPTVKMALYRSTTQIAYQEGDEYTHSDIKKWIEESSAQKVAAFTLNDKEAGDYSFTGYTYRIKYEDLDGDGKADEKTVYDADGNEQKVKAELAKYDEYGNIYYYYAIELGDAQGNEIPGYKDDPVYNAAYFYLTNVYDVTKQPYVKIQVGKEWAITKDALEENPDLEVKDLAPVDITLYAVMQDENGNPIGDPIEMQTITYDPNAEDTSAYDSVNIDSTTGSIYATFSRYEAANSTIPYYAPNGRAFLFYVTETDVDGYYSQIESGGTKGDASDQNDEAKRHYINLELNEEESTYSNKADEKVAFTNTYTGTPEVSFSPVKYWKDAYVDNSNYRPYKIRFKVERTSDYYPSGDGWSAYVYLSKTNENKTLSKWTVNNSEGETLTNLLKYDIKGNKYTYRITEESFLNGADQVIGNAYNAGDVLCNYQYASSNNKSITNRLNKSTTINLKKNWAYQLTGSDTQESFTYEVFDSLRRMNALPLTVKFVVEQKESPGSRWSYVSASDESSDHKVTVDGQSVVGYEVNINDITADNFSSLFNTAVTWNNLPSMTPDDTIEYDYRVSEILTWQNDDGSTEDKKYEDATSYRGVTSSMSSQQETTEDEGGKHIVTTYTIDAQNILQAKKVRLAKEWVDNGGRDNTRPDSLVMTIQSVNGEHSFTLNTSKDETYDAGDPEASVYYSDYFYVPGYVDVSDFQNIFTLKEKTVGTKKSDEQTLPASGQVEISTENGKYKAGISWPTSSETDGTYVIKVVNTLDKDRKTIEIHANKAWQDNEEWEKALRPTMTFTLQYLKQGGDAANENDWCDMGWSGDSWIELFTVIPDWDPYYRAEPSISHVGSVSGGVTKSAGWYYLKKYWDTPSKDGQAEPIQYRVRESYTSLTEHPNVTISSYTPVNNPVTFVNTKTQDPTRQTITNKIQYSTVQLIKNWQDQDGNNISLNDVDRLVDLKALPKAIRFEVSYNGNVVKTCDFNVKDLSYGLNTSISLPRYNAYGEEITYTIRETMISYDGTNWQESGSGISLETDSQSFTVADETKQLTFNNTLWTTQKSVVKAFKDEADRDKLQGNVVVKLYRDDYLYDTVTLTGETDPSWTHIWSLLPKYRNSGDELSVYRIEEVSVNGKELAQSGYTVNPASPYTYGENDSITLINKHNPYRGTITGKKVWSDIDGYETKDTSVVYLALQYRISDSSDWSFAKGDAELEDGQYKDSVIPEAYTTSALVQKADGASVEAVWENVPVNYDGAKITYRAVEVDTDENDNPIYDIDGNPVIKDMKGYNEAFASAAFEKGNADGQSLSLAVTNELITQTASITKNWKADENYSDLTRPENIIIELSWTHGEKSGSGVYVDGTWQDNIILNEDNKWTCENISLPLYDSEGNAYSYTVTEKYQFDKESEPIEKSGYSMAMTMTDSSSWELKTTEKENVWMLEQKDTAEKSNSEALSLTAENTLKTGSLEITKSWDDDDNREAKRQAVAVQLYRDGEAFGDPVTLSDENGWKYKWENIPICQINGDKSYYTVKETDASDWIAIYPDGIEYDKKTGHGISLTEGETVSKTITNKITPNYFDVTAQKAFDDADDVYGVSATSIWVQLLYSTDKGDDKTWKSVEAKTETDGTKVYTSSDIKQKITITKDASGSRQSSEAVWKDLPEKVRMTDASGQEISKTVYYKVVECTGPDGEASTDSKAFYVQSSDVKSYADRDAETNTAALTLTNTLPRGNLKVEKTWDDVETGERSDVSVKLYRMENGEMVYIGTKALTPDADNENLWICIWNDLPLKDTDGQMISYVIEEISVNGYSVSYSKDASSWIDAPEAVLLSADSTIATYIKNTQLTGKISIDKAWQDESFEDERPSAITYKLYRNDVLYKTQEVQLAKDGSAAYTFDELPIYDKDGKTFIYRVEEDGINGYKASYTGNDNITLENGDNTATVTVTNTLETAALKVSKNWLDEDDRDRIRPSASADAGITLQLYRDGKPYREAVTVYQEKAEDSNVWEYEWSALPLYKADKSGEKSVYYVVEITPQGYTSFYGADQKAEASSQETVLDKENEAALTVTNLHVPDKSSVKAVKVWDDQSDRFGKRPESIYLTLMYRLDDEDEWQMVEKKEADEQKDGSLIYPDGGVYTTSDVIQKLSSSKEDGDTQSAIWNDLPLVYNDGTAVKNIYYKVFETNANGEDITDTAENYRVTYSTEEGQSLEKDKTAEETVTNKLMSTILTIDKIWDDDENWVTDVRPTKLTFLVEYSLDKENWQALTQEGDDAVCVDGMAVLEPDENGDWPSLVIENLPLITRDGTSYSYRVREYSMEIDGETIMCGDAAQGESAKAGAYDGTTALVQNEDETWSAECTNSIELGDISVTKIWQDGQNRDGQRAKELTFELHRLDTINGISKDTVLDTRTIEQEKDGSWPTITWANLPIWSRDGADKALYYVAETADENYSTTYQIADGEAVTEADKAAVNAGIDETPVITVTNTYETKQFTVNASKIWDDNSNARGLRDSSVSFTLQYSLDNGRTWKNVEKLTKDDIPDAASDKGTDVWTSSDVTQTISGNMTDSKWTGFSWENLPAYALGSDGSSIEVLYRVAEEVSQNTSTNYTVVSGDDVSYSKAALGAADVSITNKVNPDTSNPDKSNSGTVNTGDNSGYAFWALLMTGAFVSMLYTGIRYRRRKKD